jgi:hypothetical protein
MNRANVKKMMQGDGNLENKLLRICEALERTEPMVWRATEGFAVNADDWRHVEILNYGSWDWEKRWLLALKKANK